MLKVLFVTTHLWPDREFGGVVESGSQILSHIGRGHLGQVRGICVSRNPSSVVKAFLPIPVAAHRSWILHRWAFSPGVLGALWREIKDADVVFINGIYTFPTTVAGIMCVTRRKPFFVAVRGGLEPWRLRKRRWKKFLFGRFVLRPLLARAEGIHATYPGEISSIQQFGLDPSRAFVVGNGLDRDEYESDEKEACWDPPELQGRRVVLFMSRIASEKGLSLLLDAVRDLLNEGSWGDVALAVVGPDTEGHWQELRSRCAGLPVYRYDGIYGRERFGVIQRCSLFVLPSHSENFGNVVAEALACGKPVLTTLGTPWRDFESIGCGWVVPATTEGIRDALRDFLLLSDQQLHAMGNRGREFVLGALSWDQAARELWAQISAEGRERSGSGMSTEVI